MSLVVLSSLLGKYFQQFKTSNALHLHLSDFIKLVVALMAVCSMNYNMHWWLAYLLILEAMLKGNDKIPWYGNIPLAGGSLHLLYIILFVKCKIQVQHLLQEFIVNCWYIVCILRRGSTWWYTVLLKKHVCFCLKKKKKKKKIFQKNQYWDENVTNIQSVICVSYPNCTLGTDLLPSLALSLSLLLRDRMMLLKLEQDILEFINDDK